MVAIEKMGLLKMDFLGLTTLHPDRRSQTHYGKLTLEEIPLVDEETYREVFHKGLTSGVFSVRVA